MSQSTNVPAITVQRVAKARKSFVAGEPRNLFYLVATELIDLASRNMTKVSVAQALAVLLQTWNVSFYRFRKGFHEEDLTSIQRLLNEHMSTLQRYRDRSISSLSSDEEDKVRSLFTAFVDGLGAVGAAKSLHLLAPYFFPLWDRAIAKAYRVKLDAEGYLDFMRIARTQCQMLTEQRAPWPDLLKAIDEFNYCVFTLKIYGA